MVHTTVACSREAERAGTAVAAGMIEAAAALAAEATAAAAESPLETQSASLPNPEAYSIIGRKSRVPSWAVPTERSRRQPLVNLNAISRRDVRWWESVRAPRNAPAGARAGMAGDDRWVEAYSMAEIAAKVASTPSDPSIRRRATPHALAPRVRKEP